MSCRLQFTLAALALCLALAVAEQSWGGLPEGLTNALAMHHKADKQFDEQMTPWVEQVGKRPRAFLYHNFLTNAERAHVIKLAAPYMKRSTVVGNSGNGVVDDIRTSYGMFIRRLQDPIIERIEKRIALWTHIPVENQEDIQVLRYQKSQTYGAHYDSGSSSLEPGPKWRVATFLMYLSDVEEGGETAFPVESEWFDPTIVDRLPPLSKCAQGHVAAKPKAGDGVLFYSFHPNGTMDPAAMHTGCPVIKGIKWAAPVWMHDIPFRPETFKAPSKQRSGGLLQEMDRDPGKCADYHPRCADWAEAGECERNPGFMKGDSNNGGMCRKACKNCENCHGTDVDCINRNREMGGYLKLDRKEMEWLGVDDLFVDESPEL